MRTQTCSCVSQARLNGRILPSQADIRCLWCLGRGFVFAADGQPEADIPGLTIIVTKHDTEQGSGLNMELRSPLAFRPAAGRSQQVDSVLDSVLKAWAILGIKRGFTQDLFERCAQELRYAFIGLVAQGAVECSKQNPIVVKRGAAR